MTLSEFREMGSSAKFCHFCQRDENGHQVMPYNNHNQHFILLTLWDMSNMGEGAWAYLWVDPYGIRHHHLSGDNWWFKKYVIWRKWQDTPRLLDKHNRDSGPSGRAQRKGRSPGKMRWRQEGPVFSSGLHMMFFHHQKKKKNSSSG